MASIHPFFLHSITTSPALWVVWPAGIPSSCSGLRAGSRPAANRLQGHVETNRLKCHLTLTFSCHFVSPARLWVEGSQNTRGTRATGRQKGPSRPASPTFRRSPRHHRVSCLVTERHLLPFARRMNSSHIQMELMRPQRSLKSFQRMNPRRRPFESSCFLCAVTTSSILKFKCYEISIY